MTQLLFPITAEDTEKVSLCPACNASEYDQISDCRIASEDTLFFSTSICRSCSHVFRDIRPTEEWFNHNFSRRYEYQKELGIGRLNEQIEGDRYNRYHAVGKFLQEEQPESRSVLDIGCGPGSGLDAFRDLGLEIAAIEPDYSRAKIAVDKGHSIYSGDWETYKSEQKFDLIVASHALEHFHKPAHFMKFLHKFSKASTMFYVEVPEILDHVSDWNDSLYLAHVSNFNENSLRVMGTQCGWVSASRAYPYVNSEMHQGHLSMLFKNDGKLGEETGEIESGIHDKIIDRYKVGLPNNGDVPHHFYLHEINDLSLGYKKNEAVKNTVNENYEGRKVMPTSRNCYLVN